MVSILNDLSGNSFMVFCGTCNNVQRLVNVGHSSQEFSFSMCSFTDSQDHSAVTQSGVECYSFAWANEPGKETWCFRQI